MMVYESGRVAPCLTLVLDGQQQPAPYTICFISGETASQYPKDRSPGEPHSWSGDDS
jgi:hypothetical protein